MKKKIGVIGGGNMGTAIIAGIRKKYAVTVYEMDAAKARQLKKKYNVALADMGEVVQKSDAILLAIKPQNFDDLLKTIAFLMVKDIPVISIAAGITTKYMEKRLPTGTRVIRAMPNLPAQVSEGLTGLCAGKRARKRDLALAKDLFESVGLTVVTEEKWMDAVTAVSGSGPAYVFLFVEMMQKAAQALGLDAVTSDALIRQTLKGSLSLLEKRKDSAGILRAKVTSRGGTTQAALDVFQKNKTGKIFKDALKAARKRARELSK